MPEDQRRRLLAEVSHELRTPLTVIQGNVEAIIDGVYPADTEHLDRRPFGGRILRNWIDDMIVNLWWRQRRGHETSRQAV